VSPLTIQQIMRHAKLDTTRVYLHVSERETQAAMGRLNDRFVGPERADGNTNGNTVRALPQ
jgi:hypothetical protein